MQLNHYNKSAKTIQWGRIGFFFPTNNTETSGAIHRQKYEIAQEPHTTHKTGLKMNHIPE